MQNYRLSNRYLIHKLPNKLHNLLIVRHSVTRHSDLRKVYLLRRRMKKGDNDCYPLSCITLTHPHGNNTILTAQP